MSGSFEALEDRLLRRGIAPRHVKRYLRELDEHLSDLVQARSAAGHDAPLAAARAALGTDDELVSAMLKRPDFRSFAARLPWFVFGVLPVLAVLLVVLWHVLVLVILEEFSAPGLFPVLAETMLFAGNFILVPAVALLFVFIARRQRCPLVWPILSTAVILILLPHWESRPVAGFAPGFSAVQILYEHSGETIRTSLAPLFLGSWWHLVAVQWATFASKYLLILLPIAVLVRRRGRMVAAA